MAKILAQVGNGAGKGDGTNTVILSLFLMVVPTGMSSSCSSAVDILGSAATLNAQLKSDVLFFVQTDQDMIDKGVTTSLPEIRILGGF